MTNCLEDKTHLNLLYDDRDLARDLNTWERIHKNFKPENMSEKNVLYKLRTFNPHGKMISDVDVEWYKKALEKSGAKDIEEISISWALYPPKFMIAYNGNIDFRKFRQLTYH